MLLVRLVSAVVHQWWWRLVTGGATLCRWTAHALDHAVHLLRLLLRPHNPAVAGTAASSVSEEEAAELLSWVRHQLPGRQVRDLSNDWRDGRLLGELVNALAPRSLPLNQLNQQTPAENVRLALRRASELLKVEQPLSVTEVLNASSEAALAEFLRALRRSGEKLQRRFTLVKTDSFVAESGPEEPECAVRGPGLQQATTGQTAQFTVALQHPAAMDLLLQLQSDKGDFFTQRMTATSPPRLLLEESLRPAPGTRLRPNIPLGYQMCGRTVLVRYRPVQQGLLTVGVIWAGQHVPGSPFKVIVKPAGDGRSGGDASGFADAQQSEAVLPERVARRPLEMLREVSREDELRTAPLFPSLGTPVSRTHSNVSHFDRSRVSVPTQISARSSLSGERPTNTQDDRADCNDSVLSTHSDSAMRISDPGYTDINRWSDSGIMCANLRNTSPVHEHQDELKPVNVSANRVLERENTNDSDTTTAEQSDGETTPHPALMPRSEPDAMSEPPLLSAVADTPKHDPELAHTEDSLNHSNLSGISTNVGDPRSEYNVAATDVPFSHTAAQVNYPISVTNPPHISFGETVQHTLTTTQPPHGHIVAAVMTARTSSIVALGGCHSAGESTAGLITEHVCKRDRVPTQFTEQHCRCSSGSNATHSANRTAQKPSADQANEYCCGDSENTTNGGVMPADIAAQESSNNNTNSEGDSECNVNYNAAHPMGNDAVHAKNTEVVKKYSSRSRPLLVSQKAIDDTSVSKATSDYAESVNSGEKQLVLNTNYVQAELGNTIRFAKQVAVAEVASEGSKDVAEDSPEPTHCAQVRHASEEPTAQVQIYAAEENRSGRFLDINSSPHGDTGNVEIESKHIKVDTTERTPVIPDSDTVRERNLEEESGAYLSKAERASDFCGQDLLGSVNTDRTAALAVECCAMPGHQRSLEAEAAISFSCRRRNVLSAPGGNGDEGDDGGEGTSSALPGTTLPPAGVWQHQSSPSRHIQPQNDEPAACEADVQPETGAEVHRPSPHTYREQLSDSAAPGKRQIKQQESVNASEETSATERDTDQMEESRAEIDVCEPGETQVDEAAAGKYAAEDDVAEADRTGRDNDSMQSRHSNTQPLSERQARQDGESGIDRCRNQSLWRDACQPPGRDRRHDMGQPTDPAKPTDSEQARPLDSGITGSVVHRSVCNRSGASSRIMAINPEPGELNPYTVQRPGRRASALAEQSSPIEPARLPQTATTDSPEPDQSMDGTVTGAECASESSRSSIAPKVPLLDQHRSITESPDLAQTVSDGMLRHDPDTSERGAVKMSADDAQPLPDRSQAGPLSPQPDSQYPAPKYSDQYRQFAPPSEPKYRLHDTHGRSKVYLAVTTARQRATTPVYTQLMPCVLHPPSSKTNDTDQDRSSNRQLPDAPRLPVAPEMTPTVENERTVMGSDGTQPPGAATQRKGLGTDCHASINSTLPSLSVTMPAVRIKPLKTIDLCELVGVAQPQCDETACSGIKNGEINETDKFECCDRDSSVPTFSDTDRGRHTSITMIEDDEILTNGSYKEVTSDDSPPSDLFPKSNPPVKSYALEEIIEIQDCLSDAGSSQEFLHESLSETLCAYVISGNDNQPNPWGELETESPAHLGYCLADRVAQTAEPTVPFGAELTGELSEEMAIILDSEDMVSDTGSCGTLDTTQAICSSPPYWSESDSSQISIDSVKSAVETYSLKVEQATPSSAVGENLCTDGKMEPDTVLSQFDDEAIAHDIEMRVLMPEVDSTGSPEPPNLHKTRQHFLSSPPKHRTGELTNQTQDDEKPCGDQTAALSEIISPEIESESTYPPVASVVCEGKINSSLPEEEKEYSKPTSEQDLDAAVESMSGLVSETSAATACETRCDPQCESIPQSALESTLAVTSVEMSKRISEADGYLSLSITSDTSPKGHSESVPVPVTVWTSESAPGDVPQPAPKSPSASELVTTAATRQSVRHGGEEKRGGKLVSTSTVYFAPGTPPLEQRSPVLLSCVPIDPDLVMPSSGSPLNTPAKPSGSSLASGSPSDTTYGNEDRGAVRDSFGAPSNENEVSSPKEQEIDCVETTALDLVDDPSLEVLRGDVTGRNVSNAADEVKCNCADKDVCQQQCLGRNWQLQPVRPLNKESINRTLSHPVRSPPKPPDSRLRRRRLSSAAEFDFEERMRMLNSSSQRDTKARGVPDGDVLSCVRVVQLRQLFEQLSHSVEQQQQRQLPRVRSLERLPATSQEGVGEPPEVVLVPLQAEASHRSSNCTPVPGRVAEIVAVQQEDSHRQLDSTSAQGSVQTRSPTAAGRSLPSGPAVQRSLSCWELSSASPEARQAQFAAVQRYFTAIRDGRIAADGGSLSDLSLPAQTSCTTLPPANSPEAAIPGRFDLTMVGLRRTLSALLRCSEPPPAAPDDASDDDLTAAAEAIVTSSGTGDVTAASAGGPRVMREYPYLPRRQCSGRRRHLGLIRHADLTGRGEDSVIAFGPGLFQASVGVDNRFQLYAPDPESSPSTVHVYGPQAAATRAQLRYLGCRYHEVRYRVSAPGWYRLHVRMSGSTHHLDLVTRVSH